MRDILFLLDAPFDGSPHKLAEIPVRFRSVKWGNNGLALVEERRWKDRKRILEAVAPDGAGPAVKLFEGSFEDLYHDPGDPFVTMNAAGKDVLQLSADGSGVYLHARGASAEGDRPFVSVMSVKDGESKRVWQSEAQYLELPTDILDATGPTILIRKESPDAESELLRRESREKRPFGGDVFCKPLWQRAHTEKAGAQVQARGWCGAERKSVSATRI